MFHVKHDRRLPSLTEARFRQQLTEAVRDSSLSRDRRPPLDLDSLGPVLYRHYLELRRWNPRVSLVGPGTAGEVLHRHYGESLAGLDLIGPGDRRLVDVGSGAGFPGLVLAAARPALDVTLLEPRERKWLFLQTAVRKSGLSCRCLNARVGRTLPGTLPAGVDLVTCRALALWPEFFELFHRHSPRARFLVWHGEGRPELPPPLGGPGGSSQSFAVRREIPLAGSRRRRILEICPPS